MACCLLALTTCCTCSACRLWTLQHLLGRLLQSGCPPLLAPLKVRPAAACWLLLLPLPLLWLSRRARRRVRHLRDESLRERVLRGKSH